MESKNAGGAFAKVVQKTITRTKTKVLQNMGKADKTTDGKFVEYVSQFNQQQVVAARLHKEIKHYIHCVKEMTKASKELCSVINETFEAEWVDVHTVDSAIKSIEMLYDNYEAELFERVQADMLTYVNMFPPVKEKISKRKRKQLDYDDARHHLESVLGAKKKDDAKIVKAQEQVNEKEHMYKSINDELNRELPQLHDYRVVSLSSNLGRLYSAESTFHLEIGKLTEQLYQLMESVPKDYQTDQGPCNDPDEPLNNTHEPIDLSTLSVDPEITPSTPRGGAPSRPSKTPERQNSARKASPTSPPPHPPTPTPQHGHAPSQPAETTSEHSETASQPEDAGTLPKVNGEDGSNPFEGDEDEPETQAGGEPEAQADEVVDDTNPFTMEGDVEVTVEGNREEVPGAIQSEVEKETEPSKELVEPTNELEEPSKEKADPSKEKADPSKEEAEPSKEKVELSEGREEPGKEKVDPSKEGTEISHYQNVEAVVEKSGGEYEVIATHQYVAEDEDELSFEPGNIIRVVPFEDPDEQDDGWLMGHLADKKGVFPANFTRKFVKRVSTTTSES